MSETDTPLSKTASRSYFIKPTVDEIRKYLGEHGITTVDPEKFWTYYESVGWMIGKKPMKSWVAAIRTWNMNAKPQSRPVNLSHDTLTGTTQTDNKPCQYCGGKYPCSCYIKLPLDYNDKNTYDEWWRALGRPNTGFGK